ncbi:MAG TPA: hypothetical protein VIJ93_00600 [bacterium]
MNSWNDFLITSTNMMPSKLAERLEELEHIGLEIDYMPLKKEWVVFHGAEPIFKSDTLDKALDQARVYAFPDDYIAMRNGNG